MNNTENYQIEEVTTTLYVIKSKHNDTNLFQSSSKEEAEKVLRNKTYLEEIEGIYGNIILGMLKHPSRNN